MDVMELLRDAAMSAVVFVPVLLVSAALGYVALRMSETRRRLSWRRWLVGVGSVLVASAATAVYWASPTDRTTYRHLLITLAVPFGVYLLVLLLVGLTNRRVKDDATRLKLRKAFIYLGILVVALTLINLWLIREQVNVTTVLSVMGAGIALSLNQVLLCAVAWLVLLFQRHYDVGDRVQIGEIKGDVSDVGILHTTLVEIGNWVDAEQSTGRLVAVPNSQIFAVPVFNYTRGFEFIWNEISILVTFESNWRKAQQILLDAIHAEEEVQDRFRSQIGYMSQKYMVLYQHLDPIVYPKILESGVQLTLRYLVRPKRRRSTETEITAKILDAFVKEPDIDFAYPTQRRYDYSREGKPALKAKGDMPPADD